MLKWSHNGLEHHVDGAVQSRSNFDDDGSRLVPYLYSQVYPVSDAGNLQYLTLSWMN